MNNIVLTIIGIFVLFVIVLIVLVVKKMRGRKLSDASKQKVGNAWRHALSISDPVRRVMEADKVLDLALTELGYKGTLGEKLKKAGPRFSDVNAVWRAHKLRNTLAHETGAHANQNDVNAAIRTFERALADLG
jgi:hypothetical protein